MLEGTAQFLLGKTWQLPFIYRIRAEPERVGQPLGATLGEKWWAEQQTGFEWSFRSLPSSIGVERGTWMLVGQGTDWATLVSLVPTYWSGW